MPTVAVRALSGALLALALGIAACGGDAERGEGLRVVTTVAPITSIVENIGGDRVAIEGIVPEGTNSHTFEPAPSVARVLADADLVVLNGLALELPSLRLAEANRGDDTVILQLGDRTVGADDRIFDFSFPASDGRPNPHTWTDPMLALAYARVVADELAALDPEGEATYRANLAAFETRIVALDAAIRAAVATVPEGQRRLLTYHDSWPYFALRYGFEVVGAVQPSDFAEPSAREIAGLVDQVRDLRVPAIFGSEVFPSEVLETIARESGAAYVDDLRDDDLPGEPGDALHSYLGLMVVNMRTMIPALGGDASALDGFDTGPVFSGAGRATYPQ